MAVQKVTLQDIVFPSASGGAWAQAVWIALLKAASGGVMRWKAPLDAPVTVPNGSAYTVPAGGLRFSAPTTGGLTVSGGIEALDAIIGNGTPTNLFAGLWTVALPEAATGATAG